MKTEAFYAEYQKKMDENEAHNEISTYDDDLKDNIGTQSGMAEVDSGSAIAATQLCIDKIGMSLCPCPLAHRHE
jgi:hypothetical protein